MLATRASTTKRLARSFATAIDTKASGVKVAAVDNGQPTTAVTVFVQAGSRYQSSPGVAHVLKNFAFKALYIPHSGAALAGVLGQSPDVKSVTEAAKSIVEKLKKLLMAEQLQSAVSCTKFDAAAAPYPLKVERVFSSADASVESTLAALDKVDTATISKVSKNIGHELPSHNICHGPPFCRRDWALNDWGGYLCGLKDFIAKENWSVRGKFPPGLKLSLADVTLEVIHLGEYDDDFFNYMPTLFPYNRFTMMKLIKRMVSQDHYNLLTARQDELLEQLAQLTKEGFPKAQEEWEKSVTAWRKLFHHRVTLFTLVNLSVLFEDRRHKKTETAKPEAGGVASTPSVTNMAPQDDGGAASDILEPDSLGWLY
ncbi:hypothetical protein EV401DRAFT_2062956 [Pisolithus croceorrhizus]|nr:hypothetical protein EV401DRAFT_2062956 [Pisolithus croceorrhizus]